MKTAIAVLALATLILGGAGSAAGQEPPRVPAAPAPPRATRHPRAWAFSMDDHHGRLGVLVNTGADPAMDSVGARLEAVTPGGPAAKAGLKAGDVITRFNGTGLAGPWGDDDESGPGQKLVQLARALAPGDTVQIEYRRGGGTDVKKTTLVAAEVGGMGRMMDMDRVELRAPHVMDMLPHEGGFSFCFGDAWCDMELVSLNPDLGEYFGTKEGVLVVKAPADSSLPLKSGDVIQAIGARKPTSASHAMRILRSYDTGETVTIEVMRKQKRTSITWHVPSRGERGRPYMRVHRDSDEDDPN